MFPRSRFVIANLKTLKRFVNSCSNKILLNSDYFKKFLTAYDQQVKNLTCIDETGAINTNKHKKAIGEKIIFNCFNNRIETNKGSI